MMTTSASLKILLEHAKNQRETSAREFGQLTLQQKKAEDKLNMLLEYKNSYQTQLQNVTKNGIDHVEWLNFIAFMRKLDSAIDEQRQHVTTACNNKEAGGKVFLTHQRQFKSYDTLAKRREKIETQLQMKREQKEQDEFASTVNSGQNTNRM